MKVIQIITLLLYFVQIALTNVVSDTKRVRRLTNSEEAEIEEFPYLVSLHPEIIRSCSGVLVSRTKVLTTDTCVMKKLKTIKMGHTFWNHPNAITINIKETSVSCENEKSGFNVGLITLEEPINVTKQVNFIQIELETIAADTECNVASFSGKLESRVYKGKVSILSYGECEKFYATNAQYSYCTRGSQNCVLDRGVSLVCNDKLVGISSAGICGVSNIPSHFIKLSKFSDYIDHDETVCAEGRSIHINSLYLFCIFILMQFVLDRF